MGGRYDDEGNEEEAGNKQRYGFSPGRAAIYRPEYLRHPVPGACRCVMDKAFCGAGRLLGFSAPRTVKMDIDDDADLVVQRLPIRFSNALAPNVQIHQFPLMTRPLQPPPAARSSGKRIRARVKPNARRMEIHVPADTRPEVWNAERGRDLGAARVEDDREKNQEESSRSNAEPRLSEVRLRSEEVPHKGVYMLGVVREGAYLVPLQV